MVFNFSKNKGLHPLEAFKIGHFVCSKCKKSTGLESFKPLEMGRCPSCNTPNFIPLNISKFWLVYPLGGGGMGTVYKAYHEDYPDYFYAVKILPREEKDSPDLIENLKIESETIANLGKHPCIVSGVEYGFKNDEHYLAAEFIQGERLDKRIERLGTLPESEVLLIALRILSAETHIYNCGYLFRDLKPENILITRDHGAYLYDYGICIPVDEALHPADEMVEGSPFYMPPERLTGTGEGPYSEIYSLGMILYHAIAGKTYFSATEIKQLARQLMRSVRLSNIDSRMKAVTADVAVVIDKMIKRNPEDRYQNFLEAEKDILNVLYSRF